MTEAYPLHWPVGWPRTEKRNRARAHFSVQRVRPFSIIRDELLNELKLLGADRETVIISSNIPLRLDGIPRAGQRAPDDVGVAVYFELNGQSKCFPCDKWDRVEDNLRAISLTINALRGLDRWGSKHMADAAFQGFDALPAQSEHGWWVTFDIERDAPTERVANRYRVLARHAHPDTGGDVERFHEIQAAYEEFKRERGES